MKISVAFFFCFGLTFGLGLAQALPERELLGQVIADDKNVADVHVMNTSLGKATITNESGRFRLSVRLGDTLLFYAIQFRRRSFIITQEIYDARVIAVPLEEFVNELEEVVLRPYDLSGDLGKDMQQINTEGVVSATILGLPNSYHKPPTQAERKLFEATTGGGLVPLNPILNAITGRTKYFKKILQTQSVYARTERVREFYADSLFVLDLRIPSEHIDDFMYYCEVDPGFSGIVDSKDRLQIWEFLREKSGSYREVNELD